MTNTLAQVGFHGDVIEAAQDHRGVWASLKRMCESLGLDLSGQLQKLKKRTWAIVETIPMMDASGRKFEMVCLHLDAIPMWLATIEPSCVKPAVRGKLSLYQKEAAKVLAGHFLGRQPDGQFLSRGELREVISSEIRNVLGDLRQKQAEPMYTIKDRLCAVGWPSATPRQRDQIRHLALVKLSRHGFPRPDREGNAPSAEYLFPASQCHLLDEAILQIWEEARFNERGGMFDGMAG